MSRIALKMGVDRKSLHQWRDRYLAEGIDGLYDRDRPGRPVKIGVKARCDLISMACAKPSDFDVVARSVWTYEALRETFVNLHPEREMSRTSVIRILNEGEIRPHRVRYWLHSPDPKFKEKVNEIVALYLKPPKGSVVLCMDEKTGMQALGRKHPTKPAGPSRAVRYEHEYIRNGTRKLLAIFNPHGGEVYGEVRESRTAEDLVEFMEEVARIYPRKQMHIIWDNLNIHYDGKDQRWEQFNLRHGNRFHFHYTPKHASWVNQIECWFSVLQRRVLKFNSFSSLVALDEALVKFINHWNENERKPFCWTFKGYPRQMESVA